MDRPDPTKRDLLGDQGQTPPCVDGGYGSRAHPQSEAFPEGWLPTNAWAACAAAMKV